jgi:hypothetical protein
MPIKKGTKRTWEAGKPKLTGEVVGFFVRLTREQYEFIMSRQENAASYIRKLISREMAKKARE